MPRKKKAAAAAAAAAPPPPEAAAEGGDDGGVREVPPGGQAEEESSPKPTTPPPTAQSPARVRRNIVVAASDDEQPAPEPGNVAGEESHAVAEESGSPAAVGTAVELEPEPAEQPADEDASRRAAYELAASIAAEEERLQSLEQVNAEYMQEVARRQAKREGGDGGGTGALVRVAHKQEVVPKASGTDAKTQHKQLQGDTPDEQRRRAERVRLEAEEAARELEKQGLAKTEREVREREEREREAMLQRQRAMDAGNNGSVSISRAEAVPPQHIRCLTTWVNSVLPEHMAISEPCELLTTRMTLTLLAERLAGQVIQGIERDAAATASSNPHEGNLARTLHFLNSVGANKFCTEYQTLSCGGVAAVCDLLWEMAERFVMEPQFEALAVDRALNVAGEESPDALSFSQQGWMEGARAWVHLMTRIHISDFAQSFQNGAVLLAIVVAAWPGSQIHVPDTLRDNSPEEVLELALSIAQHRWQVPQLLTPSQLMHGAEPACVLLYLSLLARRLPLAPAGADEAEAARKPPVEASLASHAPSLPPHEALSSRQVVAEAAPPAGSLDGAIARGAGRVGLSAGQEAHVTEGRPSEPAATHDGGAQRSIKGGGLGGAGDAGARPGSDAGARPGGMAALESHLDRMGHDVVTAQGGAPRDCAQQHDAPLVSERRGPGKSSAGSGGGASCGASCPSCHEALVRPRLLRCLHIFCVDCLESMAEQLGPNGWMVRCPACDMATPVGRPGQHSSFASMNSDEGVLKVMALLSDTSSPSGAGATGPRAPSMCDNCLQASATVWCGACEAALCAQCSAEVHGFRSITAGRQHNPSKLLPGERAPTRLPTCQVHPGEQLLFLSISSQQLICRECVLVGGHDKDRYVPVEDAGRQTRVDLADLIKQVEEVARQVERAAEDAGRRTPTVMDTFRARTQHLSSRADALKAAMQERREAVLKEIAEERDRKSQRLLVQGVGIGRVAVALEHGAHMGRLLMKRGNDLEVLRASQSLERLLRATSGIAVSGTPVESAALFSGSAGAARYDLLPRSRQPHEALPESDKALSTTHSHRQPASQSQTCGAQGAPLLQVAHSVPAPSTRADAAHSQGAAKSASQTLISLPEAILTPMSSISNSPNGVDGLNAWGTRKNSSDAVQHGQQQVNGVRGLANGKVGWGARSGQSLYAVGGFDGASNLDTMEFLDSSVGTWREAPPMSCARRGLAAAAHEGRIYVMGGWDGRKYLDSMAIFDTFTGRWTMGPAMLCPRCFAAAAFVGPHLYVVGGYYGATNLRSAERYDPKRNEWLTLPNMATARRGLGAAAYRERLLLAIGGWDGKMNLNTVECLDVRTPSAWTALAPLKVPRCSLSCASSGNVVYVCGGWDGTDYLASVECFNPEDKDKGWKLLTRMNTPRSYGAACICESTDVGTQLIVVGGWDGVGTRRLASSEVLSVADVERREGHTDDAYVGAWSALPAMTAARYGGALVSV